MNKNKTLLRSSASVRIGWLSCACIAAGLLIGSPEPVSAGWLKELFAPSPSNSRVKQKQRQRQQIKRERQRRKLEAHRQRAAPVPKLELPPGVDDDEPVQIVISLPTQRMTVYKGGVEIASTRVSSGKAGHTTPSGVFSILQKKRHHFSNIYDNAPMPFMQRLTWSGVALHAGYVPNYPASHGCIRMPSGFASQLFRLTDTGGHVLITADDAKAGDIQHAKLFQPAPLATIFDPQYLTAATRGTKETAEATPQEEEASGRPRFTDADRRQVSTTKTPQSKPDDEQQDAKTDAAISVTEKLHVYGGRNQEPLRILITRRTKRERVVDIQDMLNELGYDVGVPDGQVGKATRDAIRDFQKKKGLTVTGTESDVLWSQLNSATGTWRYSTGHLYVRQGMVDLFDEPVTINQPSEPLGTHVYTAMHFHTEATKARWTAVTLKQNRPPRSSDHINDKETLARANAVTAAEALERVEIADRIRRRIEAMLTPASSLIISDNGIDARETTKQGTDFIVRTW